MSDTNNLFKKQLSEFVAVIKRVREMEWEDGLYPEDLLVFILKYALTLFDPLKNDLENQEIIAKIKAHWERRMSKMTPCLGLYDKSDYFLVITTFEEAPGPGFSREIEILQKKEERESYEEMLRSNIDPSFAEQEDDFGEVGGGNFSTELYTYDEMFWHLLSHFAKNDYDYQLLSKAPFIKDLPEDPFFLDFLLSNYN